MQIEIEDRSKVAIIFDHGSLAEKKVTSGDSF